MKPTAEIDLQTALYYHYSFDKKAPFPKLNHLLTQAPVVQFYPHYTYGPIVVGSVLNAVTWYRQGQRSCPGQAVTVESLWHEYILTPDKALAQAYPIYELVN